MFLPQCIMVCKDDQLELTDQLEGSTEHNEFTFENKWTSGPLKQFNSSSPDAFQTSIVSILTVEIIR